MHHDVAPDLPTTGLINSSLVALTNERLSVARLLDHPGESGRAREEAIRQHIQEFLPGGLGLEAGFVVDASGGQSRQIDLILYHKTYYPIFRVNGIAIVPIEAVVAVFEIKADVGSRAVLTDCYQVLASVKRLDRSNDGRNPVLLGGGQVIDVSSEDYQKFQMQVLGAVVAEKSITTKTWSETTQEWCRNNPRHLWPNFFVSAKQFVGAYQVTSPDDNTGITTDTVAAEERLVTLAGPAAQDPLSFLTHEVLNFSRVAVQVDYFPESYFGGARNLGVVTYPFFGSETASPHTHDQEPDS